AGGPRCRPRSSARGVPARIKGPLPQAVSGRARRPGEGSSLSGGDHAGCAMRAEGRSAAGALLGLGFCLALAVALPIRPAGSETAEKRYPSSKAAELKARLLDRPAAAEAPSWAAQYVVQPEIDRLDPVARAAERIWAA